MARYNIDSGRRGPAGRAGCLTLVVIALLILVFARTIASYAIEVKWWEELGQFDTGVKMLTYSLAPVGAATLLAFAVLWISHARALKFAGTGLGDRRLYARVSTAVLLVLSWMI